jgi:siroheme synthase
MGFLVPAWMSSAAFGAIVAVGFGLGAVSLMTLNAGRSTRSVAHVLYDTDTEPRDPVKAVTPVSTGCR